MEYHNSTIEYMAALVSFLLPFYLASIVYELFKMKGYSALNVAKLVISIVLLTISYWYLQSAQRNIAIAYVIALAIVMAIAISLMKLFKK